MPFISGSPAGIGLPGFGTIAAVGNRGNCIFVTSRNNIGNCNLIDPITGDYILDEQGRPIGGDVIAQKVFLALVTVRGSASDMSLGLPKTPLLINEPTISKMKTDVMQALQPMIKNKQIAVTSLVIQQAGNLNRVEMTIQWRKLGDPTLNSLTI